MKKFNLNTLLLLALVAMSIVLGSCKKLLDIEPENSVYENAYWKNENDARSGLAGVYALTRKSLFRGGNISSMSHFAYGDLSTGEFKNVSGDFTLSFLVEGDKYYGSGISIADFIGPYLEDVSDWTAYYQTITMANTVLNKVPVMPEKSISQEAKNEVIGQAYFLRAFSYFSMVQIWGDVPLVLKYDPDPVSSVNIPRTAENTVLDSCLADLNKAENLLDYGSSGDRSINADKGAVLALKAHVLRWHYFTGKNTDKQLLTQAISAMNELVNNGGYSLVAASAFSTLFRGSSAESIFEISTRFNQNEQANDGFYYRTTKDPYLPKNTSQQLQIDENKVNAIYTDTLDARYRYNFDRSKPDALILTKYTGKSRDNIQFVDPQNQIGAVVDCNVNIFRLGEILLLRAECNNLLGNTAAAISDINKVRARAQLSAYAGTDLTTEIFEEGYRENFCEGKLWNSMVRNNKLTDYTDGRFPQSRFDAQGWKWPISRGLLQLNPLLSQNTFWNGKL